MPRISDQAVKKATGKNRAQWFKLLDQAGAKKMSHKEIARWLYDQHLDNGWWAQMITVEYEYARKKRVVGKTADVGFEVSVTKTLPISPQQAWDLITSSTGQKIWLGTSSLKLRVGETYKTSNGTSGEIRTVKDGQRIRLTWQPNARQKPTTLQVTVIPRQTTPGTCLSFHHEKLASRTERQKMRTHWKKVLRQFEELVA